MHWRDEPTFVEEWFYNAEKVHSILAIDESGTATFKTGKKLEENQWFVLSGIQLIKSNVQTLGDSISQLKNKYWEDGLYNNKSVVLHSRDIRKKEKAFSLLKSEYSNFRVDLDTLVQNMDALIFSCSINKRKLQEQYIYPKDPYELSLTFLIERYATQLNAVNAKGIILLESRGYHDDKRLLKRIVSTLKLGTDFVDSSEFNCIIGVYFGTKHQTDGASNWPLELADLTAYRIRRRIEGASNSIDPFDSIKSKIYGAPKIIGRGLKIFPKNTENGDG
ncbi:DUF3800 domain-containing protein [Weissella viridescens]|uniref:DUF3800 domain-containing protein n=1 Tax=Weissella viridescens TaxID=1629 RepID=UPI0022DFDEBE|nr:DUF3800 domain-containing protein [Weissella viridescens]